MIIKCILQTLVYRNYAMLLILFIANLVILKNLEGLLHFMTPSMGLLFQLYFLYYESNSLALGAVNLLFLVFDGMVSFHLFLSYSVSFAKEKEVSDFHVQAARQMTFKFLLIRYKPYKKPLIHLSSVSKMINNSKSSLSGVSSKLQSGPISEQPEAAPQAFPAPDLPIL